MKTIKKLMTVIFIALLLHSCDKEKQMMKDNLPGGNSQANGQRIAPVDMEAAMNSFITLANENHVIDCPGYEAEDALLIMEAALNYKTCMPDSGYDEVKTDTTTFNMELTKVENGEFMFSNEKLNSVWAAVLDSATEAHNRVSFNNSGNPFNIVVDLEFLEFDRESEASTQTAVVQVII